jgi:hypothetical protein
MRRLACFLAALPLVACSSARDAEPSKSNESVGTTSSPIINGTLDTAHDAVVAILTQSSQDQGSGCTGTIVKVDGTRHIGWVVTAAHCVDFQGLDPRNVYVVQGEDYSKNTSILYRTIDFTIHDGWNPGAGFASDFAVIRIAGVDGNTPVIPLASNPDGLSTGKTVTSVGYGMTTTSTSSTEQNTLRYAIQRTIPTGGLSTSQISYSQSGGGICHGDSGGPVLFGTAGSEKVVGIHSYVSGGCGAGSEGNSGRVSSALTFFNQQLSAALPKEDCNLCEMVANSGTQECAAITQGCYGDPECQGFFDCMQAQGATRTECTQKFPKIEGMYAAVAACTCTRACADTCGATLNCKLTPKCGYKLPAGSCTTCTEASCCTETFDCTANGDCYLCLKNGDKDPSCADNPIRKKLATCVATSCKADCEGSGLDNGAEPPAEEGGDPAGEGQGTGEGGKTTTTTTDGCAMATAMPRRANGSALALGVLAMTLLASRRRRRL